MRIHDIYLRCGALPTVATDGLVEALPRPSSGAQRDAPSAEERRDALRTFRRECG